MRKMFLGFIMVTTGLSLHPQDQAALKPILKQIALLKTYIAYLEKGYAVARKGLNTIGDIKGGHFQLDIAYFNSLKHVNPKIKKYAKVAMIAQEQAQIIKLCARMKKLSFNNDEISYINAVAEFLLNDCETLADELITVISDSMVQMSDDERLREIDRIYEEVHDEYEFIRNFYEQGKLLIRQRHKDEDEVKVSRKLNGL